MKKVRVYLISTALWKGWRERGLREILVRGWFREMVWMDSVIMTPCAETAKGATRQTWEHVEDISSLS